MDRQQIEMAFQGSGLMVRGGFTPDPADGLPGHVKTVVMIGNAGPEMWRQFARSTDVEQDSDPLDRWISRVVGEIAVGLAAVPLYPSEGPPYHPFQRWARRAEQVWPSPIGPLVHIEFGLWHAYRAALLFPVDLAYPRPRPAPSPCDSCADKPCLQGCPVDALAPGGYDVAACAGHLGSGNGRDCLTGACLARRACPLGRSYHYLPDQAHFHMRHFLQNHG